METDNNGLDIAGNTKTHPTHSVLVISNPTRSYPSLPGSPVESTSYSCNAVTTVLPAAAGTLHDLETIRLWESNNLYPSTEKSNYPSNPEM